MGGEPDVVSHNALMMALVRADRLPEARALLGRMRAEGLAPQVQTYGSLMDGYACRGQVRETVELFEEMLGEGHRANIVTLATLAKALAKGGRWEQVEECVAVMRALGMEVNRTVESIAIAAYSRAGRWERALELLEGFRARRPGGGVPTVMTYNSAMEGLAKAARWGEALQLLEHMASDGVIPHITSYNAAIAACVEAGRHEEAARVYGAMLAAGRSYPDACTCRRMLVVYGVLGRHAEALELAHTVLERPPEERRGSELVHGGAFAPYFLLCAQQGRADEARAMLDLLAKTDYPLDHASASAAAMALAKGGRPEEALQLSRGAGAGSGAGAEDLEVARVAAIMRALGRAGHWASALYLLDELRVKGQAAEVEGPLAVLVALEALAKAPGALPLLGPRLASQAEQDGNALGRVTSENPGALRLDLHTLLPLPAAQAAVLHAMGRAAGRGGCSLEVVLEGTEAEKVPALMEGIRAFCTSEGIKYSDANPRHLVIREADIEKWARRRDLLVA
jgi:pentatricopeptide repeat protein